MRLAIKGLALINTIVLARILVPEDFGLVAMAMSVIAALELFRQFSFEVALIQRQDAPRSYYDTAWTFNVIFALVLSVVLIAVASPAAVFYEEPRLRTIIWVLAASVFISGFENIGVIAFIKDLTFHKEFLLRTAQKLGGVAVTIPLAFILRSYWALVIGMITGNVVKVVISYFAHPFRPRLSLSERVQLFGFSKWLLANNILWFIRDRTPDFILGKISGPGALGLFTVGNEISNLPTTELVAPINRAVFPAYAKMAHDRSILQQGFLNVIGLVVIVALPAGFGVAATADLLVSVVLGEKWAAAVPIVSIMAMFGALNALQTNCGPMLYAMGTPRVLTMIGLVQITFLVPSIFWGAYSAGAVGIAWAYLANVALIIVPLNYGVVLHKLGLSFGPLLSLLWRPAIGTALMYAAVVSWIDNLSEASIGYLGALGGLTAAVAIGAVTYSGTVLLLWLISGRPDGPESTVTNKFIVPTWRRIQSWREDLKPN